MPGTGPCAHKPGPILARLWRRRHRWSPHRLCSHPVWERADDATKEAFKELIEHIGSLVDVVDLAAEFDTALEHQRIIMEADLAKTSPATIAMVQTN